MKRQGVGPCGELLQVDDGQSHGEDGVPPECGKCGQRGLGRQNWSLGPHSWIPEEVKEAGVWERGSPASPGALRAADRRRMRRRAQLLTCTRPGFRPGRGGGGGAGFVPGGWSLVSLVPANPGRQRSRCPAPHVCHSQQTQLRPGKGSSAQLWSGPARSESRSAARVGSLGGLAGGLREAPTDSGRQLFLSLPLCKGRQRKKLL